MDPHNDISPPLRALPIPPIRTSSAQLAPNHKRSPQVPDRQTFPLSFSQKNFPVANGRDESLSNSEQQDANQLSSPSKPSGLSSNGPPLPKRNRSTVQIGENQKIPPNRPSLSPTPSPDTKKNLPVGFAREDQGSPVASPAPSRPKMPSLEVKLSDTVWIQQLVAAASDGNLTLVSRLLKASLASPGIINQPNAQGYSALLAASLHGHSQVVLELLNFEAIDVNAQMEEHGGDTALHVAGSAEHAEVVALLLYKGANADILNHQKISARANTRGPALAVYEAFDNFDSSTLTNQYPILSKLIQRPNYKTRPVSRVQPPESVDQPTEIASKTRAANLLLPTSIPKAPPKPTEAPPSHPPPMHPPETVTVVKTGWMLVNRQPPKKYCELKSTCEFAYFSELGGPPVERISLQFKFHVISDDMLLRRKCGPVVISDETGQTILTIEYDSFAELEDWVRILEALNFRLVNKTMRPDLCMLNGWIHHTITVWNCTWNVGNTPPQSLDELLTLKESYDLVVVGAQECTYKVSGLTQTSADDWFSRVIETIERCNGTSYYVVASLSLLEIRLIIFAKRAHEPFIGQVRTSSVATGIANVVGNKGGVGISFHFHSSSFLFITSHLAAHQDMSERRNQDFKEVIKRMRMGNNDIDIINRFHYIMWSGDLNYRIDLPFEKIIELVYQSEDIPSIMMEADQLKVEMKGERCFEGFLEMPISFWPTYRLSRQKYDAAGNRVYNDEKLRKPSWCDRVLWRTFPGLAVQPEHYYSVPRIDTSDHCPVVGTYRIHTAIAPGVLFSSLREDAPLSRCYGILLFNNLKAKGIKWSEDPSPFIRFWSKIFPPHLRVQTTIAPHTYAPEWGDVELVCSGVPNKAYFYTSHVILEFLTGKIRTSALGQAVVSLQGCPKRFNEPILLNGETVGYIAGSITIKSQATDTFAIETVDSWPEAIAQATGATECPPSPPSIPSPLGRTEARRPAPPPKAPPPRPITVIDRLSHSSDGT